MGAVALTIRSERELGAAVLFGNELNVDGAFSGACALPAGFGDCYVVRAAVFVSEIATMMTNPEIFGPEWVQVSTGVVQDLIGSARWVRSGAAILTATYQPLIAPLWREGEVIHAEGAETDTNAVPTADYQYYFLVQRRRNMPLTHATGGLPVVFTS